MGRSGGQSSGDRPSLPVVVAVVLLTVAAFAIRLQRLGGPDGGLDTNESRLALAAQGVLATGLPTVPSGRIYTRGMISAYLMAPSLWLFGPHDFAARLPSTVVGALLIPLVFVFGRAVAGTAGGLCAAAFAVVHPELINWSVQAWMPSLFVLVFVGTAYLLFLGFGHDRPTMQLAGAGGFVVALLVHELAVLLPMAVLATLALRAIRRDVGWFAGRWSLAAFALFGVGLVLFVALGLLLRMGTIAGPTAEFQDYFRPVLTLASLRFYYQHLLRGYPLLLAATALGILFWLRSLEPGVLFLYMTIVVGMVTLGFLLSKSMERYGIMLLPLLAILAAWSLGEGAHLLAGWGKLPGVAATTTPAILLAIVFGMSLRADLAAAMRREDPPPLEWLAAFEALGPAPGDPVFSDGSTIIAFYRGKLDYWARVRNYQRYTYLAGDSVRELYTGAVMVSSEEDFQRVVEANPGRTLWYVGNFRKLLEPYNAVEPALRDRLLRIAQIAKRTRDGWIILRIDLGGSELR